MALCGRVFVPFSQIVFWLSLSAGLASQGQFAVARTLMVGPGQPYSSPSEAANAAQDGDQVLIAAGDYTDCAVWRANNLTIAGTAPNAAAIIGGPTCQGKGLFVAVGNDIVVRNLTLKGARDQDHNGAGIRGEGNNLTVDGVKFLDNEEGILAAGSGTSKILVENSSFARNGICEGACAHAIYVGPVDLLRVEHSTFSDTLEGHHIKSRAHQTEVVDCVIADTDEGTASLLIDIPNGGNLIVHDNTMQKGPKAENHLAAIRIGEEGVTNPVDRIEITDNKFRNSGDHPTAFVWNDTKTPAILRDNQLAGDTVPLHGAGEVH
ncbi:MAG: right-handed parallel beta-helix repeat-containing protein [Stellaceae bacterium]